MSAQQARGSLSLGLPAEPTLMNRTPSDGLVVWAVGVTADDDVGVGASRDAREARLGPVLVEVLVDAPRAAVDEQEAKAIHLEPDLRMERPEPGLVGIGHMFLGPGERAIAQRLLHRVGVGAAALLAVVGVPLS